jgi:predicted anti-sigma-YlaC factor YlaD
MTRNAHDHDHDEARELIVLGNDASAAQHVWLRAHLAECESCRRYNAAASEVVRSVRSLPIAADARLVRATQMRVRFHASRLRQTRERFWLVGAACLGVGLSATLTVPIMWRLFAWLGESAGVSSLVWQAGFALFCIAPALVAGVALLARGTYLADHDG